MGCFLPIYSSIVAFLLSVACRKCIITGCLLKVNDTLHISLPKRAFLTVWNSPSEQCLEKFGVKLNLSMFDIIVNDKQKFVGSQVTIFYENELGHYPHILENGSQVYGGVPQNTDIWGHIQQTKCDVKTYIPDKKFQGLGVIDWESWRPLWDRNFDSKKVYQVFSKQLIAGQHPEFNESTITAKAREAFENGSRIFMNSTLKTVRTLRPGGYWGFYGFPACYNLKTPGYECSREEMQQNDRLRWMFNSSSALFPSIYLMSEFIDKQYVINILKESQRLSDRKPIYPYSRITYKRTQEPYTKGDLLNTVLVSADMGTKGIVLWEAWSTFQTRQGCETIRNYLDSVLGPFVQSVTTFFEGCAVSLCSSHGKCVKTKLPGEGSLDIKNYRCQCDQGWHGTHCGARVV